MEPFDPNNSEPGSKVALLINEYFDRRESGEELTPEAFAAEHPELAEELKPYLAGLSLLNKVRSAAGDAAVAGAAMETEAGLPVIEGYEVLEEIARGGMGVVYKAMQIATKRVVAVKVMLAGPFASEVTLRRFDREVQLAARLEHPLIVRVLESGGVAGRKYYAMDYMDGVRLDRYLTEAQPSARDTLRIFQRICEAVEHAHEHGVIHRDLKPANVLVDEAGEPHILDFGLAKATDQESTKQALTTRLSTSGQVLGTLFYLSPEQASAVPEDIDARADVYALGVMLFEAMTGSLPYDTKGRPSEVLERIAESPPTLPSSLSDRVDRDLEAIILKALEKSPAMRYSSAGQMRDDIHRYLEGDPVLARRASSFYYLRKKMVKHRMAVTVGVIMAAALTLGFWMEHSSRQRAIFSARRQVLQCQRALDVEASPSIGGAETLYARFPGIPETALLWAKSQYYNDEVTERAILFLERRLEIGRPQPYCRMLLAEIYRATGNVDGANALEAESRDELPDTAESWYLRSYATFDRNRASECLQQAVTRDPSHAFAWERLAWLCFQSGNHEGAWDAAERLLALGETPVLWNVFKGQVLTTQHRFTEAIEHFNRANEMNPRIWTVYLNRALAYRRLKEYDKAVEDYTTVVEARSDVTPEAWHLYQRATPLWMLGRTEEAVNDYRRARGLLGRPTYGDARQYLILCGAGQTDEAKAVLQRALHETRDHWLRQIFRCLDGQLTPEQLVEDARSRDNPEQLCEAYYYAAETCLLLDRAADAKKLFEQCVGTGVDFDPNTAPGTPMNEYELAEWRLESLFSTPSAP